MSTNDENIDMTDPTEGEIRVKRTSSSKEKSNKSKVSEKLISDDMDSSNINNYTPSTRSTRFPGRVSVQGVKSLGDHFACLCRGFEFYEVKKNILLLVFKKKMEILLHF